MRRGQWDGMLPQGLDPADAEAAKAQLLQACPAER